MARDEFDAWCLANGEPLSTDDGEVIHAGTGVPLAYWCQECKDWRSYAMTSAGECVCRRCGETILCDECGQPWPAFGDHEHTSAGVGS